MDRSELGNIVIVGAGLGGLRTAERLRHYGFGGQLVLVGAESHPPYDRPPLSKNVLADPSARRPDLRSATDLESLGIELVPGCPARSVNTSRRLVEVGDRSLSFDALVIATGVVPRRVPGISGHVLRTFEDAATLRRALGGGASIAVVGAGLIGSEVAATTRALGMEVHLIDSLPTPLAAALGDEVGREVLELHRRNGTRLHMSQRVLERRLDHLRLDGGATLRADVVVEAVGARPEVEWLNGSGVRTGFGVECDHNGWTGVDRIYAVGDVATWAGARSEHWTNAFDQADRVAAALLGVPAPAAVIPYWWSDQFDVKIQCLGQPEPEDDVAVVAWGPRRRTVAVRSRAGRVTAVVGFSAAPAVLRSREDVVTGASVGDVLTRLAS